MGLEDFKATKNQGYRRYGSHKYDKKLERWVEEFQHRFPVELDIEFVEVSPNLSKHSAKAYRREGTIYFIRMSEFYMDNYSDKSCRLTLLHEMVHVYFYQMGYSDTNHDKYFRWVLGRVGGSIRGVGISNPKWQQCVRPFLEEENNGP